MSQYVQITLSLTTRNSKNIGLHSIIEYIGKYYLKTVSNKRLHKAGPYEAGIEYLNRKCKKYYKRTIRRLVYAERQKNYISANTKGDFYRWYFHKRKASCFFAILEQELHKDKYPITETEALLKSLYNIIHPSFPEVMRRGEDIISTPYKAEIGHARTDDSYTDKEQASFSGIYEAFESYNTFYYE